MIYSTAILNVPCSRFPHLIWLDINIKSVIPFFVLHLRRDILSSMTPTQITFQCLSLRFKIHCSHLSNQIIHLNSKINLARHKMPVINRSYGTRALGHKTVTNVYMARTWPDADTSTRSIAKYLSIFPNSTNEMSFQINASPPQTKSIWQLPAGVTISIHQLDVNGSPFSASNNFLYSSTNSKSRRPQEMRNKNNVQFTSFVFFLF